MKEGSKEKQVSKSGTTIRIKSHVGVKNMKVMGFSWILEAIIVTIFLLAQFFGIF